MKRRKLQMIFTFAIFIMAAIFVLNGSSIAADICTTTGGDQGTPVEISGLGTGLPNIMFIFDNSDSMQDSPYLDTNNNPVRPDREWRRGYTLNSSNQITAANDYQYVDEGESIELNVPIKEAVLGTTNVIISNTNKNTNETTILANPHRIYDINLDWTNTTALQDALKRVVRIDGHSSGPQYRTIGSYSASSKCWTVYNNSASFYLNGYTDPVIDYSQYDKNNPNYTYTILSGNPGEVTHREQDTSTYAKRYIYDANVDWTYVIANWNTVYKYAVIEILDGTNKGQKLPLEGINTSSPPEKRWYVTSSPGFPEVCDRTTRYRILSTGGATSLDRKAYGGSHPASKLYQAKKALLAVLNSSSLQKADTGNYKLNIGFATYLSGKIPRVTSRYYAKITGTTPATAASVTYRGYYKKTSDASDMTFYHPNSDTSFIITGGQKTSTSEGGTYTANLTYTGVSRGFTFYYLYNEGKCDVQHLLYTVVEIEPSATDSLPNRKRYLCVSLLNPKVYQFGKANQYNYGGGGGRTEYGYKSPALTLDYNTLCTGTPPTCNTSQFPPLPTTYNDGKADWALVDSSDGCYTANPATCTCTPATTGGQTFEYYNIVYSTKHGDYTITDPSTAGYVNKETGRVRPTLSYTNTSSPCSATNVCTYRIIPDIWMIEQGIVSESDITSPMAIQCKKEDGTWESCSMSDTRSKRVALVQVPVLKTVSGVATYPIQDVEANSVEASYFAQLADGTTTRPFGWSYRRTKDKYMFRSGLDASSRNFWDTSYTSTYKSEWGDTYQKSPYFPADSDHDFGATGSIAATDDTSNDFANYRGDDQVLFVNLPKYNGSDANYGDDIYGNNITKIKGFIGLGRVNSPNLSGSGSDIGDQNVYIKGTNYDYTIMPYTNSLARTPKK